jgi:hypothetical protein
VQLASRTFLRDEGFFSAAYPPQFLTFSGLPGCYLDPVGKDSSPVLLPLFTSPIPLPLYPPKSLPVNLFADPHPLNLVLSYRYKNIGGQGHYYTWVLGLPRKAFRATASDLHPCLVTSSLLSPFLATHPKNPLVSPIIATLPKRMSVTPVFATHLRPPRGVGARSLFKVKLPTFNLQLSTFDLFYPSPFLSHSCTLFCTFLHSRKTQPFYFQAIPHSLHKTPGVGEGRLVK